MQEGSGNVGAMNSYDVTGSKSTGIIVLLIDFLKGLIPIAVLVYFYDFRLPYIMLPAVLTVIGHNYSIFLGFKGGRGLATAAGAALLINFWLLVVWCAGFFITAAIKRSIHWGNIVATILMPLVVFFFGGFFVKFTLGYEPDANIGYINALEELLFVFSSSLSLIILLGHINPIVELLKKSKSK